MERELYDLMAKTEDRHWWFLGRRRIVQSLLDHLSWPPDARILEAGCGSGGNLPMLSRYGQVFAFEMDEEACALAAARGCGTVERGELPGNIPFPGVLFDCVILLDVLEHIDDDGAALRALNERLKPGGTLIMTVPAFPWLWSRHDVINHHKRRYTRRDLRHRLAGQGFSVTFINYYNFWLFPAAAALRAFEKLMPRPPEKSVGLKPPSPPLNRLLTSLFSSERFLLPLADLPFGISVITTAQKRP